MTIQRVATVLENASSGDRLRVDAGLNNINLDTSSIGIGSKVGSIFVSTSPTLLKVEEEQLEGRTSVFIINQSDYDIYIGFDISVSPEKGIPIYSGSERIFNMNRSQNAPLYAYCEEKVKIIVCEVK